MTTKTWCYSLPHTLPKYNSQKNLNNDAKSYDCITITHSQDTPVFPTRPTSLAKPMKAKE